MHHTAAATETPYLASSQLHASQNSEPVLYGAYNGTETERRVGWPFRVDGLNRETAHGGQFDSNLLCRRGASNIDNACQCPGTRDSVPWEPMNPRLRDALFESQYNNFRTMPNVPNCAGKYLIKMHGMY